MINILCFGDSNTYGVDPKTQKRLDRFQRWPGVLQKLLGPEYYVIEEGLAGRTTIWDDPMVDDRNGFKVLGMLLDTHSPIDLIIIMLGGNDLKARFSALPEDTCGGIERMIKLIRTHIYPGNSKAPKILIIAPVPTGMHMEKCPYFGFTDQAVADSRRLPILLENLAERWECFYVNAGEVAQADEADQVHMNANSHRKLALKLAELIRTNTGMV